jgi:hypothetical protein
MLQGYKRPQGDATKHGEDIVVMRYARDESGEWPAPRPEMRLRSMGPMQRQVSQAARRLHLRKPHPSRTPLSDLRASGQRFFARRPARHFLDELRSRIARRRQGDEDVRTAA